MKRIKVLIATDDRLYCERIEEYIQEMGIPIELSVITDRDYFLCSKEKELADIVLVSLDFKECVPEDFLQDPQVFLLSHQREEGKGYKYINPYQKTEVLLKDVILKHGEMSGDISLLSEKEKGKKLICFYSPCGGSGKTTLAAALAERLSQEGKNVFYLNLDIFSGTNKLFSEYEKGGFSEVLLALKQNARNQFFVAAAKNIKRSKISHVQYFSDLENPCDLEDVKEDELERLLTQMMQMKEIDIVIADVESALTFRTKKVLEHSDLVFMPVHDCPLCRNKLDGMMEAAKGSVLLESALKKGIWVVNKSGKYSKLAESLGENCLEVPELAAVKEAQKIDQIGAIMRSAVKDLCARVLEGCEE